MAVLTYDELISEIAGRLGRDDLDPDPTGRYVLRNFAADRIDYYKRECFYDGQVQDTSITTVPGTRTYAIPTGWEEIVLINLLQGGVWVPLEELTFEEVEALDSQEPSTRTPPACWALYGTNIRLGPGAPNGAYNLELTMNLPSGPPAASSSNFWTGDARSLVINGTAAEVAATYLNDPIREKQYRPLELRELRALQAKTIRHRGGIQIKPHL